MAIATALPTEARRAARRSLFMSALVFADGRSWPVRVRNLSADGAMIEGLQLPESGSVQMCRGSLNLVASIVWADGKRRGLRFHGAIDLEAWLPSEREMAQQALDKRMARVRASLPDPKPASDRDKPVVARVGEELRLASRRIEAVLDRFSDDPAIIANHAADLTQLEVLQQLLERLGTIVKADDPVAEAEVLGMDDVRRRLLR